jgi:hypothetical protein
VEGPEGVFDFLDGVSNARLRSPIHVQLIYQQSTIAFNNFIIYDVE